MNPCDIFDLFRSGAPLTEDDRLDFVSYIDAFSADDDNSMMAVSGLTLALIENDLDEDKFRLLLKVARRQADDELQDRIFVGILMTMIMHDRQIRKSPTLLDDVQDALTSDAELSFTALCNIARTTQVPHVEMCNKQLAGELMPLIQERGSDAFYNVIKKYRSEMERIATLQLDQNFAFFKDAYKTPFFLERAANWFLPWTDDAIKDMDDEDREQMEELLDAWTMCDSDRYAACRMFKLLHSVLKNNLQIDSMKEMGVMKNNYEIMANGYVQQMYRFFRLSPFTQAKPFELACRMREMIVYRLVIVGAGAQETISELLD